MKHTILLELDLNLLKEEFFDDKDDDLNDDITYENLHEAIFDNNNL